MSVMQKIMETVAQFMPDKESDPLIHQHGHIGKPFSRVDAQLKVKGEAHFTAEFKLENPAYAALVCSTIAKGRVSHIDTSAAEQASGFIAVITHENAPPMKKPSLMDLANLSKGSAASDLPILQDDKVHWDGQPVAVVVAETLEQAEHAASLVRVASS